MSQVLRSLKPWTDRSGPLLPALVLGYLWFILINHLRIEWSVNAQYSYGWAVPFLCAYLLWQRMQGAKQRVVGRAYSPAVSTFNFWLSAILVAFLALAYAPIRLIQEANPEWRLISWSLAFIVIGLTLLVLHFGIAGSRLSTAHFALRTSDFVFPLGFFLVAVPWFRGIEAVIIQSLTQANATFAVELLSLIGIPALQHGNVIEVSTGVVGIDDACSGIRSFQATLMISLFLGELYRFSVFRRLALCLTGFALSFFFNVGRTTLLTWVAARDGVEAIAKWHDPAGVTILVGCFLGLWLIALALRSKVASRKQEAESGSQSTQDGAQTGLNFASGHLPSGPRFLASALAVWLVAVGLGVELWYRAHESPQPHPVTWAIRWPDENPAFAKLPMTENARQLLRYDEAKNAVWQEADGSRWQGILIRWNPGRVWRGVVRDHNPSVCLPASGRVLVAASAASFNADARLPLKFLRYEFEESHGRLFVYFGLWEEGAVAQALPVNTVTTRDRLRAVSEGRRNRGMQSFELIVWGINDPIAADVAAREQLAKLIVVNR